MPATGAAKILGFGSILKQWASGYMCLGVVGMTAIQGTLIHNQAAMTEP